MSLQGTDNYVNAGRLHWFRDSAPHIFSSNLAGLRCEILLWAELGELPGSEFVEYVWRFALPILEWLLRPRAYLLAVTTHGFCASCGESASGANKQGAFRIEAVDQLLVPPEMLRQSTRVRTQITSQILFFVYFHVTPQVLNVVTAETTSFTLVRIIHGDEKLDFG